MRSVINFFLVFGFTLSVAQTNAADIVHDAEYYVLEKQNGERWSLEDKDLDQRLAEFRKKNGGKPPIFSTY